MKQVIAISLVSFLLAGCSFLVPLLGQSEDVAQGVETGSEAAKRLKEEICAIFKDGDEKKVVIDLQKIADSLKTTYENVREIAKGC